MLMPLNAAASHVQQRVHFTAAIQQISTGKRALMATQNASARVSTYHVLHVADASRSFFPVTWWGDELPSLSLDQHASADAALRVGDITLFSNCLIKSFRGNVEAQFSVTQSSSVQLLYRKDRYFSTHNVRLKDLYPMIEWYKQHRHSFLPMDTGASSPVQQQLAARVKIKDLRENMVANVVCKIRERTPAERSRTAQEPPPTAGTGRGASDMLGGVLLRELVMQDDARESSMLVNLWDQHAEAKFVVRLLSYSGIVELQGVVISFNGIENRLLANTTPQTSIRFLDIALDSDAAGVQRKLTSGIHVSTTVGPSSAAAEELRKTQTFVSVEELEESTASQSLCVLDGVRIEQVLFDQLLGTSESILPESTPLLVERYCGYCDEALPVLSMGDIPPSYGECRNQQDHPSPNKHSDHANRRGLWRYRPFLIILRDTRHKRLQLRVDNQACVELVANIPAETLMYPFDDDSGRPLPFDVRSTVAAMLTALIMDGVQTFRADIDCRTLLENSGLGASLSHNEEQHTQPQVRVYSLISLTPSLLPNGRLPV